MEPEKDEMRAKVVYTKGQGGSEGGSEGGACSKEAGQWRWRQARSS
jgi:hypothetical protein